MTGPPYPWKFRVPMKVTDVETGEERTVYMEWVQYHWIPQPKKQQPLLRSLSLVQLVIEMTIKLSEALKGLPEGSLVPYQSYKACLDGLAFLEEVKKIREKLEALMLCSDT